MAIKTTLIEFGDFTPPLIDKGTGTLKWICAICGSPMKTETQGALFEGMEGPDLSMFVAGALICQNVDSVVMVGDTPSKTQFRLLEYTGSEDNNCSPVSYIGVEDPFEIRLRVSSG